MGATCGVIFLGASEYDRNSAFTNPVFKRSKFDFEDYLRRPAPRGLDVTSSRVLDLFNSTSEPGIQLRQISKFAEQLRSDTPDCERDLIVYYVGHGYFAGYDRQFYVALASMDPAVPDATGLRIASLGEQLKRYAKSFRIYYVLDCCFAGEALKALMAGGEGIAVAADAALKTDAPRARSESPRRGSALLCATSKDDFAMAPSHLGRTVFTDAMIEALRDGDSELGPHLTLAELAGVVWDRIQAKHCDAPDHQVRPFVYAPDQSDGDVSTHVPLFPNPAWRPNIEPTGSRMAEQTPMAHAGTREPLDAPPAARATERKPDKRAEKVTQSKALPVQEGKKTRGWFRTLRRVVAILALLWGAAVGLSFLFAPTPPRGEFRNADQACLEPSGGTAIQTCGPETKRHRELLPPSGGLMTDRRSTAPQPDEHGRQPQVLAGQDRPVAQGRQAMQAHPHH